MNVRYQRARIFTERCIPGIYNRELTVNTELMITLQAVRWPQTVRK